MWVDPGWQSNTDPAIHHSPLPWGSEKTRGKWKNLWMEVMTVEQGKQDLCIASRRWNSMLPIEKKIQTGKKKYVIYISRSRATWATQSNHDVKVSYYNHITKNRCIYVFTDRCLWIPTCLQWASSCSDIGMTMNVQSWSAAFCFITFYKFYCEVMTLKYYKQFLFVLPFKNASCST